jgi:uncharacterized protein (TIGR02266 family)
MPDRDKWTAPSADEAEEMRAADAAQEKADARSHEEMRAAQRVNLRVDVSLQTEDNFFQGFSENLSEGGVFISTLAPPLIGTAVNLALTVGDDESVRVQGVVRWIRVDENAEATGCGVQFTDLSTQAERAISLLIAQSEKDPLFFDV